MSPSLQLIFINGKGSSGKDTQAELLLKTIPNAIRISTGDIYRSAREQTGEFAKYSSLILPYVAHVDNGGYLPDELIVGIVKDVIKEKTQEGVETFVFTGFPRTESQLNWVDKMITKLSPYCPLKASFLYYELSNETSRKRAAIRREQAVREGKPIRPDDKEEIIERRLQFFRELTLPMLQKLEQEGRLLKISAQETINEIHTETRISLGKER